MKAEPVKKSTVFIDLDGTARVYGSVDEIPHVVRQRLMLSASSWNSATILIADRRGKEEVARALRGLPTACQFRFLDVLAAPTDKEADQIPGRRFRYPRWLAILLVPATALLIWFLVTMNR